MDSLRKAFSGRAGIAVMSFMILLYYITGEEKERSWDQLAYISADSSYNVSKFKMPQPKADQHESTEIKSYNESHLEELFSQRRQLLKDGCREKLNDTTSKHWVYIEMQSLHRLDKYGKYYFCRNQKVGSTSWRAYATLLKKSEVYPRSKYQVNILPIRHPFDRLKSAYTDKFLDGLPISEYNAAYRNSTGSTETWNLRWKAYWLPALISLGQVKENMNIFKEKFNSRKFIGNIYKNENPLLQEKFFNATFSFTDFLNYVIWTYEKGLADRHWAPQSEVCKVCNIEYNYIIKLETSSNEIPYVFRKLNFSTTPSYKHKHISTKIKTYSYEEYFRKISKELIEKIYNLYKYDFLLFGYLHK